MSVISMNVSREATPAALLLHPSEDPSFNRWYGRPLLLLSESAAVSTWRRPAGSCDPSTHGKNISLQSAAAAALLKNSQGLCFLSAWRAESCLRSGRGNPSAALTFRHSAPLCQLFAALGLSPACSHPHSLMAAFILIGFDYNGSAEAACKMGEAPRMPQL